MADIIEVRDTPNIFAPGLKGMTIMPAYLAAVARGHPAGRLAIHDRSAGDALHLLTTLHSRRRCSKGWRRHVRRMKQAARV